MNKLFLWQHGRKECPERGTYYCPDPECVIPPLLKKNWICSSCGDLGYVNKDGSKCDPIVIEAKS